MLHALQVTVRILAQLSLLSARFGFGLLRRARVASTLASLLLLPVVKSWGKWRRTAGRSEDLILEEGALVGSGVRAGQSKKKFRDAARAQTVSDVGRFLVVASRSMHLALLGPAHTPHLVHGSESLISRWAHPASRALNLEYSAHNFMKRT